MGIRGLETFMEKHSNACEQVNIIELLRQFRREHKYPPVIVIDGMSIMRFIYKFKNLSWILGGQLKEYEETLKEFIYSFLNEGAELVFFFDGPCASTKRETWVKRRYETLEKVYDFLDALNGGASISGYERDYSFFMLPSNLKLVTVITAKQSGCKVFCSVRECDLEISEYAAKHRCMAILAQDSDFIIFYASFYYFSMKNFNLNRMTTVNYDSRQLASYIGISTSQLPLFASLLGNDVISSDKLKPFHGRLLQRRGKYMNSKWIDFRSLFLEVARFVKPFPGGFKLDIQHLEAIASQVFSDSSKASLIQDSLLSYDVTAEKNRDPGPPSSSDNNWSEILKKVHELHINTAFSSTIYSIIACQEYTCSTCLEDYRLDDLPASQEILKPLREKLYGILLYEKPGSSDEKIISEMVMCGEKSLDEPVLVKAVYPNVKHPGLLSLWNGTALNESWQLIGEIFDATILSIKTLPPFLVIPALTLKYINDRVTLESWELKGLISSAVLVHLYNPHHLSKIWVNFKIQDTRPIRLYTLVSRSYSTTMNIFDALGNPIPSKMTTATNYQDGKLFHHKYHEAKVAKSDFELCDRKEVCHQMFTQLMDFISSKN